jgi:hypothetical protein
MKTIEERIAKYFNVNIDAVEIGESEERENYKGKKLQSGKPVYVLMNTGVEEGELVNEFAGWIINGKWYNEQKDSTKTKFTYQILAKDTVATQKTFTRTVSNNYNAYNEFEEEARKYFDGYEVQFNHPGKLIILSYKEQDRSEEVR